MQKTKRDFGVIAAALGLGAIFYLSLALKVDAQTLIMPLDDAYIHFQYARQMAEGQPYRYNPEDAPSSGATSFLYTPLLAIGYQLGFQGLDLGLWALFLGLVCHLLNTWLIYLLLSHQEEEGTLVLLLSLAYGLSGAFFWAALSGMETSLFLTSVLGTLFFYQLKNWQGALLLAGLAALVRPEGALVTLTTLAAVSWERGRPILWPALAIGVQPAANFLLTGSASAAGNLAKSHLYNVTLSPVERLSALLENWLNIWAELALGSNPVDGWYMLPILSLLGMGAALLALWGSYRARKVTVGALAFSWILSLSLAIASLDTAFWHFKRYQLPLMALLFPLGGWLLLRVQKRFRGDGTGLILAVLILIFALGTFVEFARRYQDNIWVVKHQQMAMADWVNLNLPAEALIAVHDVGIMRYVGARQTYDVVGLTHPDHVVSAAWRQGAGAIIETMRPEAPAYFAIYPNVQSLPFLLQAGVMGEELARFDVPLPPNTVASATSIQVVTLADWSAFDVESRLAADFSGLRLLDRLNVGDLRDEAAHGYHWTSKGEGFRTDIRYLPYPDSAPLRDGGRVIRGGEKFQIPPTEQGVLVILRVQAANMARLVAGCGGEQIRIVPSLPAQWVEIPFWFPQPIREFCLSSEDTYYPAHYWVYTGDLDLEEGKALQLLAAELDISPESLRVDLLWGGSAPQDGKVFLHIYADPAEAPVLAQEAYAGGWLPPANWLAEQAQKFILDVSALPSGSYQVAAGLYDPMTGQRLSIEAQGWQQSDNRIWLGEFSR